MDRQTSILGLSALLLIFALLSVGMAKESFSFIIPTRIREINHGFGSTLGELEKAKGINYDAIGESKDPQLLSNAAIFYGASNERPYVHNLL